MRRTLLIGCLVLLAASPASAKTGVVFIHGKGGADLHKPAEAKAYWGDKMLNAVWSESSTRLVCAYDGTLDVRLAADVVAGQIDRWSKQNSIDDIVVVTHSFGGVVIRWILSNPTGNNLFRDVTSRIRWVDSIAPPNAGSEAANMAGMLTRFSISEPIVAFMGQQNESTGNCTTTGMTRLNAYFLRGTAGRPALPRAVYNIAGTGTFNDGKHGEDAGLSTLSLAARLPGQDDGMVALYSAQSVGVAWFTTPANHHHNRRNDWRGFGGELASDFASHP